MSDRAEKRQLERARSAQRLKMQRAINLLLRDPDGREFIRWLLTITRWGSSTFTGNALTSAFAAGEQNIGIQLWGQLALHNPEGVLALLKETSDGPGSSDDDDDNSD